MRIDNTAISILTFGGVLSLMGVLNFLIRPLIGEVGPFQGYLYIGEFLFGSYLVVEALKLDRLSNNLNESPAEGDA